MTEITNEEKLIAGEPAMKPLDPYLAHVVEGTSRFISGIVEYHLLMLARGKTSLEDAKKEALVEISEEIEKRFNNLEAEK